VKCAAARWNLLAEEHQAVHRGHLAAQGRDPAFDRVDESIVGHALAVRRVDVVIGDELGIAFKRSPQKTAAGERSIRGDHHPDVALEVEHRGRRHDGDIHLVTTRLAAVGALGRVEDELHGR